MNKKEILGLCEFLKLHGYENTDNISKFIFGLQQENKQLKAQIEEYQKALDETMSEKIDIQNNWNELKECLKDVMNSSEADDKEFVETILDIIQEIEQGSDSNENNVKPTYER